jgi:KDO2-lipid IV(A) lauroyltransferase
MKKKRSVKPLWHPKYWLTWVSIGLWRAVVLLPYPVLRALGRGTGSLLSAIPSRRRSIAEININLCFPELSKVQRQALVKRHLQSFVTGIFETGISWWWSHRRRRDLVTVEGLENLRALDGQGALLLAFHFTHLDIGATAVHEQFSIDAVYKRQKNAVLEHIIVEGRAGRSKQVEMHSASDQGRLYETNDVRRIIRALKQGRVIWYAPDQDFGRDRSVFVPFFGVPTATITATSKLAKAGNARVIPMYQERLEDGHIRVTILPALANFPGESELQDALLISQLNEELARRFPADYLWLHRRFKTRPEGEPSPYSK